MTQDEIRDLAILVTEDLIDHAPHLLADSVREVNGEYTQDTFDLQDCITDAITKNLCVTGTLHFPNPSSQNL